MGKVIGVTIDGEVSYHAVNMSGNSDHNTLCGIDSDDPSIGHTGTVEARRGQKITCPQCYEVWRGVARLNLRAANFDVGSAYEEEP